MDLPTSHVLITGASRGIGAAMATEFAAAGARVSLAARSMDELEVNAKAVDGQAFAVDLSDGQQVEDLLPRVRAAAGPVDVLVNNAGLEPSQWFHETSTETMRDVLRVNLEAPTILTRIALESMLRRNRGHVVFVSSIASTAGFPGTSVYGATKAGISNLANALRMELRETPIGVTVTSPGPVDNAMWAHLEQAEGFEGLLKRLQMFKLLPTTTEKFIAEHTVDAVIGGKRHVRTPKRLAANHWLREAPTRIIEKVLTGVPLGPTAAGKR